MVNPGSIRLRFDNRQPGNLQMVSATACSAHPVPSADLGPWDTLTGFWIQLENDAGTVLYRLDMPGMFITLSGDDTHQELKDADILVPNLPQATMVAIFAPPRDADGRLPALGAASILMGRFVLPVQDQWQVTPGTVTLPDDICGQGRGEVLRIVPAVYNGQTAKTYNMVVLADKFGATEQDSFRRYAIECIEFMLSKPPFNGAFGASALNIFLVEVSSNATNPSYFNSTYSVGSTHIEWDTDCVKKVCDTLFANDGKPYWNWAGLLIKETAQRIGTAKAPQFALGLETGNSGEDYLYVFQHEFGHAAFGLSDEYGGTNGTYTGAEPANPNITTVTDPANIKWSRFLTPGVAVPTLGNPPDCGQQDTRSNPVQDSDVGSYAGGWAYSCGIFHPQYHCVMNDSIEADGMYCPVCLDVGMRIINAGAPLLIPAPGSIYYSPVSGAWTNETVATNVETILGELTDYSNYDDVISELSGGVAGSAVLAAFAALGVTLTGSFEVVQTYYNIGTAEGVWILLSNPTQHPYYIHSFQVATHSELQLGTIALPDYPALTLFDGAVVGTQVNLFSGDGGVLAYGQLDNTGKIIGGTLTQQQVAGLGTNISGLSVSYVKSSIWVGVIDGLTVKLGAYQLAAANWWEDGFITMPVDPTQDFDAVRLAELNTEVFALALSGSQFTYGVFNKISADWTTITNGPLLSEAVSYFDVCTDGLQLYLVIVTGSGVSLFTYILATGTWSGPTDITQQLGLVSTDIVSSLAASVLQTQMHIVAIVNQFAADAIYDIPGGNWTQSFTTIQPLSSQYNEIGSITLHATPTQLYAGLSSISSTG